MHFDRQCSESDAILDCCGTGFGARLVIGSGRRAGNTNRCNDISVSGYYCYSTAEG